MSEYVPYSVYLTDYQKDKLKSSINKNESCTLTIQPETGNTKLHLTKTQIDKLSGAKKKNVGVRIELSKTQLSKTGGFILPALAGLFLKGLAKGAVSYAGAKAFEKITNRGKGLFVPGRKRGSGLKKTKSILSVTSKSKKK